MFKIITKNSLKIFSNPSRYYSSSAAATGESFFDQYKRQLKREAIQQTIEENTVLAEQNLKSGDPNVHLTYIQLNYPTVEYPSKFYQLISEQKKAFETAFNDSKLSDVEKRNKMLEASTKFSEQFFEYMAKVDFSKATALTNDVKRLIAEETEAASHHHHDHGHDDHHDEHGHH